MPPNASLSLIQQCELPEFFWCMLVIYEWLPLRFPLPWLLGRWGNPKDRE